MKRVWPAGSNTANAGTDVTVTATFKGGPAGVFGVMPILFFARASHAEAVRVQPPMPPRMEQQQAVPSFNDEP